MTKRTKYVYLVLFLSLCAFFALKADLLSADQGDAKAQFKLRNCYSDGKGILQDYKKAAQYYTLAANQGNAMAQFALARCYFKGEGVTQDYNKASEYYTLAADQGHAHARETLERLR